MLTFTAIRRLTGSMQHNKVVVPLHFLASPPPYRPIPGNQMMHTKSWISTTDMSTYPTFITMEQKYSFKDAFLSDPSVYPLILIVGMTVSGFFGFMLWHIEHHVDVRFSPKKRNALFRYW